VSGQPFCDYRRRAPGPPGRRAAPGPDVRRV